MSAQPKDTQSPDVSPVPAVGDNQRVVIFDTTMRDGEQSPGCSMNLEEKLQVADVLEEMGVDVIEAGFPIASKGDFEAVSEIAKRVKNSTVAGLARATPKDIERAGAAVKFAARPRIHTFISTSPLHMKHKLQMEPEAVHQAVHDSVTRARNLCDDVEWSPEDGTRTEHDFLCRTVETAIKAVRRWGYEHKGIPEDQAEIIVCSNNFHGRTTTIVSFSSEPAYRRGFGPFTPGFTIIPYGDARAFERYCQRVSLRVPEVAHEYIQRLTRARRRFAHRRHRHETERARVERFGERFSDTKKNAESRVSSLASARARIAGSSRRFPPSNQGRSVAPRTRAARTHVRPVRRAK